MKKIFIGLSLALAFMASHAQALPFVPLHPPKVKSAGANLRQNVIFQGTPVSPGGESWKSTVQVWSDNSLCTGVVITPRVVLTAAHCQDLGAKVTMLTFFKGSEIANQKIYQASDYVFIKNPDYLSTLAHDFAVIVFKQDILPNDSYRVAKFLTSVEVSSIYAGSKAFLIGAGRVGVVKAKETYTKLNFVTGIIQEYVEGGYGIALESNYNTGICHGDSGGPMFVKVGDEYLLVGLNSQMVVDFSDQACNHRFYISFISADDYTWMFSAIDSAQSTP